MAHKHLPLELPDVRPFPLPTDASPSPLSLDQSKPLNREILSPVCNESVMNDLMEFVPSFPPEDKTFSIDLPTSPLEEVRQQNSVLSKKYAQRLLNAPAHQKAQLRLEFERRIAENEAIARKSQQAWEAQRERAVQHYTRLAEQKCRLHQKNNIGTGDSLNAQLKDAIFSCYMFEWEKKLRTMNGSMEVHPKLVKVSSPESERRSLRKCMDMAMRALRGSIRGHPLGSCLVQKQQKVHKDISILLGSHDFSEKSPTESNTFIDSIGTEATGATGMFNDIAKGIKGDLEFLESIVLSLYEPLDTPDGHQSLSQNLQKVYFPAVTPPIKSLLRLCVVEPSNSVPVKQSDAEGDASSAGRSDLSSPDQNSLELDTRFRLQSLQSLPSPFEKLDCLMEVMKSLCSWNISFSPEAAKETVQPIGADDLLSRLVSVIHGDEEGGQNSLVHLLQMEAIFLQAFLPEDMVLGEAGYCVTVLCSALAV
ncbi:uncharacterized protein LOC124161278 isoform X2 [Ischnura elegans]|nr:uncharacterized protein LOC124161278 isoform X2 [Ischnura elegans]